MKLKALVEAYQTDKVSTYQKLRYHVRENQRTLLRRLVEAKGDVELSDIRARDIKLWHMEWSDDGQKLSIAHAFIAQLRTISGYGLTMLEEPECERLSLVLHKLRFAHPQPRTERLTADHANAIRTKAHEFLWHSVGLVQAFQFEGTLRQKDCIGELVPLSEPGVSAVIIRGQKWLRGIVWQEIDENLILRHVTSKKQKLTEVDLKLGPMVMEELHRIAGASPLIVVDQITKKATINRHLLPASGPIAICDTTGLPWTGNEFRRKFRMIARAAGVPDNVWSMDSRSGAISEAIQAGAPMEFVRHAATHSDVSQTADYDRGQAEATAKVMRMRSENRNKPKPE